MKRLSLSFLLPAAIVSLCLTVAAVMATFSLIGLRATLLDEAQQKLNVVLEQRLEDLQRYFDHAETALLEEASSPQTLHALEEFANGWRQLGLSAADRLRSEYIDGGNGQRSTEGVTSGINTYRATHEEYHIHFNSIRGQLDYYDVFLIDTQGDIVYSVDKEADFATNLMSGPYAESGLGIAFRKALDAPNGTMIFEEFDPYAPSNNEPSAFFATPVKGADGQTAGVYAVQVTSEHITRLMSNPSGLEETGRVVLLAADGTRRNAPRFEGDVPVDGLFPKAPHVEAALRGEDGTMPNVTSDKGVAVVAAYDSVELADTRWSAIAEQHRSEVMDATGSFIRTLAIEIVVLTVITIGLGMLLGRWVSAPLKRLTDAMTGVADRTFTDKIPALGRKDEIGDVARSLDDFRDKLNEADKTAVEVMFKSSAFTGSSVAMMIADTDGRIIYHNSAAHKLFDEKKADMLKFWPDFDANNLVGADVSKFHQNHGRIAKILSDPSQLPFRSDVTIGEARFSINATAVYDDKGSYVGNVIEWADVAEARLNSGILGAIRRNQTVVEIDLEGTILDVNDVFAKTYGYDQKEVVGRPFGMLMATDEKGFAQTLDTLRGGGHVNEKARRIGKNGREIWVESSINGIADQSGKVFKLIEIAADITDAEQQVRSADARREEMEAQQQLVVNALRDGLSNLADGNLALSMNDPFPENYEGLRSDFNSAVGQLREVLGLVVETSANIRNGASEISQASDDLSRRTESQAATLEQTAAAMDELTESVKSASDGAGEADRVVRDAREKAEASGLVVVDAVNAMSEIEKSSLQISQIIGVIDDIAFQTNLLALNAGVEAARAGEAGRGFAVVASEVRALAQRSSEAAKEIKQLISTSSRFVENGVDLVGQAGEALKTIVTSVTEISSLVSEIASSSKEQATGLTEINSGVTMLDQVTQQNAAMVEESTAASHSLRQEAEGLTELVGRFRISSDEAKPTKRSKPTAVPTANVKTAPVKRAVGADWSSDSSADQADGWESF